jgi:CRISPR-associated protein Cas2
MGRTKTASDYLAVLQRLIKDTDSLGPAPNRPQDSWDILPTLEERVQTILGIANNKHRKSTNMLFFVMYDIESNKVRRYIVKYLEKKGCTRIQKSIFLADLPMEKYQDIRNDLTQVQAAYDNEDSILVVPITTEYLKAMKVIGQNINMDIITHTRNTLFF